MPSSSKKQHDFMNAIAHNKAFAKKVGVPQSVGQDFSKADKGKTFKEGGIMKPVDMKKNPGMAKLPTDVRNKMGYMKKGGMAHSDVKEDMPMMKKVAGLEATKVVNKHEKAMHGMKAGGMFRKAANGIAKKGLTKGTMVKMKNGGMC
jgi:hypothetical protein